MTWKVETLTHLFKAHPWHGISIGRKYPLELNAYIEIVPSDHIKYELDKTSGYLMVDRPQQFSNIYPTLYGLIPQTYCGNSLAAYCMEHTHRTGIVGDGDPLDICVLVEKSISHGDIIVPAVPIGGIRMLDGNEADDKIIAVMRGDAIYGHISDIFECPPALITRLKHYFLTYKQLPGDTQRKTEITHIYGREEAHEVIRRSQADYLEKFQDLADCLETIQKK